MSARTGSQASRDRLDLLEKGIVSYPEAMVALAHFRRLVVDMCKRVAEGRTKRIRQVFGVAPSPPKNMHDEVEDFYEKAWTSLGTYVAVGEQRKLYIGLDWREDDGKQIPRLHASIKPRLKASYNRLAKALQAKYREKVVAMERDWWCGLEEPPGPACAPHLERRLGRLTDRLLTMLNAVNVRKLLREA